MSEENGAFAAASRVLRDRSQRLRERLRGGTWAFLALCSAAIALQAVIGAPFTGGDQPQVAEKSLAPDGPSGSSEATLALARQIATLRELAENLSLQQIEVRTRLTSLEGQLDSVTGSIAPRHAGTPSMPAPDSAALPAAPAAAPEAEKMLPESADGSARVMATEFAVELTKAPDLAAIESSWQALGRIYGAELNGLTGAIRLAEGSAGRELVLIAGPLANARDAARICAAMRDNGQACREARFAGDMIRLGTLAANTQQ